jgi:hypothetical protein
VKRVLLIHACICKNLSLRGRAFLSVSRLALKEILLGMNHMSQGAPFFFLFFLTVNIAVLRVSDVGPDIIN